MFLSRFYYLLKKEFMILLRNPKTRFSLFLPPLIQMIIFGYVANMDLNNINFSILDFSKTVNSRELIRNFTENKIFNMKDELQSYSELNQLINHRKLLAALVIPENFEKNLLLNIPVDVQLIMDGRNSSTAGIVASYSQNIIQNYNQKFQKQNNLRSAPVIIETRAWYNSNYSTRYFMIPALLAMIALLDIMMIAGLSISREREEGTIDQLMVSPFTTSEILGAKALNCIFIGVFQLTFCFLVAKFWFEIPYRSSYFALYVLFSVFLFSSVSTGLMISVVSKNFQQAIMGTFLFALPFVLLSGMTTPVENMPEFFQYITIINPIRYGIQALHKLFLEGATISEIKAPLITLLTIGIIMLSSSWFLLSRQRRH